MADQTANSAPVSAGLSRLELTGRASTHVRQAAELGCMLHPLAIAAFQAMRTAAAGHGIDLQPISGFRDFGQQLAIWNGKFRGERALLDAASQPLNAAALSTVERVAAILTWSALPGASRHHWGSDCDVIDRNALAAGARAQLLSADYAPDGRHGRLASWLAAHAHGYGFFFPYDRDRGGVQPEPWHLSFAPIAGPALAAMTPDLLAEALADAQLAGAETVTAQLPKLFERYVTAVARPPAAALAAAALSPAAKLV